MYNRFKEIIIYLTEATEAMASDAPGLSLGAPLECPHRHLNFLMQVPL